jgi:hypothetical protein
MAKVQRKIQIAKQTSQKNSDNALQLHTEHTVPNSSQLFGTHCSGAPDTFPCLAFKLRTLLTPKEKGSL